MRVHTPTPFASNTIGSAHPGLQLKNRTVLIVTDDIRKVSVLTRMLTTAGYQVADVNSGEAAFDYYSRAEPDLVLLDVQLPGAEVFKICRALNNRYSGPSATVIFIAAKTDPEAVVEGLAAGGVDYLSEPFREQEVAARLRVHLLNRLRLAQLDQDHRAKNRLLCMAAHDLRNPLVSIRALANVLWGGNIGPLNPEQRDILNTIYSATQSMLNLVNELLDSSSSEAGEVTIIPESTDLAELVQTCVKLNNATAAEKGSLIVVNPGSLPERISIDPAKITQVLNNLFGNAIKFSPPGSTIAVDQEFNGKHCAIVVRDQGPGIREDERAKLFTDFGRTSVRPTGGESSTGLGLSICLGIMRSHNGTITAKNVPEGGAEFRITFPFT